MSKFDGRVNTLIKKTHNYVSNEDFCLLRDYFQSRYEEEEKPEDFEMKVTRCKELEREYERTQSQDVDKQIRELIESSTVMRLKLLIPWAIENCEQYPRGIWIARRLSFDIPKLVRDAKAYFAGKKQKGKA
jgi:hypothetical protein